MSISFPGETPEYRAARDRLLEAEIQLRGQLEEVADARRALPPGGVVPEDYVFQTLDDDGKEVDVRLSELFGPGKDSLVIYCYMFPRHSGDPRPGPAEGKLASLPLAEGPCPSCTAFLDELDGAALHVGQNLNFAVVAKAPAERLGTFAEERGWRNLRPLSAGDNTFHRDYNAQTESGDLMPMLQVFERDGDTIRHFWSSEMLYAPSEPGQDPRHVGPLEALWNMFDFTREGRPQDWHEQLAYP